MQHIQINAAYLSKEKGYTVLLGMAKELFQFKKKDSEFRKYFKTNTHVRWNAKQRHIYRNVNFVLADLFQQSKIRNF